METALGSRAPAFNFNRDNILTPSMHIIYFGIAGMGFTVLIKMRPPFLGRNVCEYFLADKCFH